MAFSITKECNGCTSCTTICPTGAITGKRKQVHSINSEKCIHCGGCGMICPVDAVKDSLGSKIVHTKRSQWPKPVISLSKCYSCEACVKECPGDCIVMKVPEGLERNLNNAKAEYAVYVNPKTCVSCGWCADYCGFKAIEMMVPEAKKESA